MNLAVAFRPRKTEFDRVALATLELSRRYATSSCDCNRGLKATAKRMQSLRDAEL